MALAIETARLAAGQETHRLYDAITAFVNNDEGRDFNITLEVRDLNHVARGPAELLLKVYDPDGARVATTTCGCPAAFTVTTSTA